MWKFFNKSLSYNAFAKIVCVVFFIGVPICFAINYFADIYGLKSTQNKHAKHLTSSKIALYKPRVEAKAPYYMIGTSRTEYIDYVLLSKYLNKHSIRLGMGGASLKELLFLTQKVKENGKNFLLGFDTFSLNINRKEYSLKKRLKPAFENATPVFWTDLLDTATFIKYLLTRLPYNQKILDDDSQIPQKNSPKFIESRYFDKNFDDKSEIYYDYEINYDDVLTLAKLADSKDIFIIFPKYAPFYALFQKYNDPHNSIEQQYFQALSLLVKTTKARVISFYGVNEITLEKDNFDDYGWHFKPKIGNLIMARIFDDKSVKLPSNFGVWLDKENIESYLESIHNNIAQNAEMLHRL